MMENLEQILIDPDEFGTFAKAFGEFVRASITEKSLYYEYEDAGVIRKMSVFKYKDDKFNTYYRIIYVIADKSLRLPPEFKQVSTIAKSSESLSPIVAHIRDLVADTRSIHMKNNHVDVNIRLVVDYNFVNKELIPFVAVEYDIIVYSTYWVREAISNYVSFGYSPFKDTVETIKRLIKSYEEVRENGDGGRS